MESKNTLKFHDFCLDNGEPLKVHERRGCVCSECKRSVVPFFFDLNNLKRAKEKGIRKVQCQKSYEFVSLSALIDAVEEIKDTTKCLVFTEDENIEICEEVLKICGFIMDESMVLPKNWTEL
jgi:hypothetical protein